VSSTECLDTDLLTALATQQKRAAARQVTVLELDERRHRRQVEESRLLLQRADGVISALRASIGLTPQRTLVAVD